MPDNKIVRCAAYTRKSHENGLELEFNSLDAQRDAVENYIKSQKDNGWELLPKHYDDGGFTGGNMERPALKQLMNDIAQGKIDCVVVYKIDRLSRSLIDFTKIMEVFNKYGVNFVSVTQQFSTVDSAGRMMLNVLMTFSQYEREIISDRISDKIAGAKRRGKYCGGPPVLGYDPDYETKKLVINPEEAKVVKYAYKRFVELGSAKKLALELNGRECYTKVWTSKKGITRGGQKWNSAQIYRLLKNPLYAGLVHHNNQLYPGEHDAIIPPDKWHLIQESLKDNQRRKRGNCGVKIESPLQGVLKCGHCGGSMGATYSSKSNGKRYVYYICMTDYKRAESICPVKRIPAGDLEKAVLEQLGAVFRTPTMMADIYLKAKKQEKEERNKLSVEKEKFQRELENAKNNGEITAMREAAKKLIQIDKQLRAFDKASVTEQDISSAFENMESLWNYLFPVERQRLIKLLIEKIEVREEGIDIELKTSGMTSLVAELVNLEEEAV